MVEGRLEWCISRQRTWGVPIPALLCEGCDTAYQTPGLIKAVATKVASGGIEAWDSMAISELVPENFACASCNGTQFKKEQDILDVWFESGISHYAVLAQDANLALPADIYLEGSDQHRGWFQSSLLTSVALHGSSPMRTIYTHGFTVDKQGRKMSKSLGNVVTPAEMITSIGSDGLRLWAASVSRSTEAVVSEVLLKNVQEVLRKVRNTARFLLSNLYDFDSKRDAVSIDTLCVIDQHAMRMLARFNHEIQAAYKSFDPSLVFHRLGEYCANDLSAFYFGTIKDRLYVETANGHERRSAQTACFYILDTLTRLMAPIMSFTAEQIADYYQPKGHDSIHLQSFTNQTDLENLNLVFTEKEERAWELLLIIREAVFKEIEQLREQKIVAHSLESAVTLTFSTNFEKRGLLEEFFAGIAKLQQAPEQFLQELFGVSLVSFIISPNTIEISGQESLDKSSDFIPTGPLHGLLITASHAPGVKCPRCWHWDITDHQDGLCRNCQRILGK